MLCESKQGVSLLKGNGYNWQSYAYMCIRRECADKDAERDGTGLFVQPAPYVKGQILLARYEGMCYNFLVRVKGGECLAWSYGR